MVLLGFPIARAQVVKLVCRLHTYVKEKENYVTWNRKRIMLLSREEPYIYLYYKEKENMTLFHDFFAGRALYISVLQRERTRYHMFLYVCIYIYIYIYIYSCIITWGSFRKRAELRKKSHVIIWYHMILNTYMYIHMYIHIFILQYGVLFAKESSRKKSPVLYVF